VFYTVTGRQATLFRAPYGEYDHRVVRFAADAGLTTIQYDLASGDPDVHATKEKLIEYVVENTHPGSIIVMHINRRGWHTAEALPDIIDSLHQRGFTFVTVGELLARMNSPSHLLGTKSSVTPMPQQPNN
jgi:peptidoglycan/xylan/chitin deacetylase (PgdA/CDA1 family)